MCQSVLRIFHSVHNSPRMRFILVLMLFLQSAVAFMQINSHKYFSSTSLYAKGKKGKSTPYSNSAPSKSETQGKADRFDALTRQFMFTITKLTKSLPDSERKILKNINLCFYPGAKIGVVGLNGSGKSSLLRIMAGIDKNFDGTAVPMPGASVGYLPQEPTLEGKTVMDNINLGVKKSQDLLDHFTALSTKMTEPLPDDEMAKLMDEMALTQVRTAPPTQAMRIHPLKQ